MNFMNKFRTIFSKSKNNIVVFDRTNFKVPPNEKLKKEVDRILKDNQRKRSKLERKYNYI